MRSRNRLPGERWAGLPRALPAFGLALVKFAVVEAVLGEGDAEPSQQRHPACARPSARRPGRARRFRAHRVPVADFMLAVMFQTVGSARTRCRSLPSGMRGIVRSPNQHGKVTTFHTTYM